MGDIDRSPESRRLAELNRIHWEEASALHVDSDYYDFNSLRSGRPTLSDLERGELGDIAGLRGVHLQCGIGLETLSLELLGASMVGIDYAASATELAMQLSSELGLLSSFVTRDVLDPELGDLGPFDFAYTSHGVLRWLPELQPWARNISALLKPGGFFYVFEIHPLVYRLTSVSDAGCVLSGDYLEEATVLKRRASTHVGAITLVNDEMAHHDWTISTIVNALVRAGLTIEVFNEHSVTSYSRKGLIPRRRDNLWSLEQTKTPIPLAFSIRATKPETIRSALQ